MTKYFTYLISLILLIILILLPVDLNADCDYITPIVNDDWEALVEAVRSPECMNSKDTLVICLKYAVDFAQCEYACYNHEMIGEMGSKKLLNMLDFLQEKNIRLLLNSRIISASPN